MIDKILLKMALEALLSVLDVVFDISMISSDKYWQEDELMLHLADTRIKIKEKLESLEAKE